MAAISYTGVAVAGRALNARSAGVYRRTMCATPEIFFTKQIDNSRLVKVSDPVRTREMVMFAASLALLFVVVMGFAFQHYRAIEYGYNNEVLRSQRDTLMQANTELRLEQASLQQPERIDMLARKMGLQAPDAAQVIRTEPAENSGDAAPIMARVAAVSVISAER